MTDTPTPRAALQTACALLLLAFAACGDDERLPLLYGDWVGHDWVVAGDSQPQRALAVRFSFAAPDRYEASLGNSTEAGSFRLSGDKLYTTAEGTAEKVVRVQRLAGDTLVLDMNRAGTEERLVLVRE